MTNHMSPSKIPEIIAGKYRVERTLGMGGMGIVVAATHLDLHEVRAIKLMRPDLADPQIVERFLREARAVVKLRSEHVAQVYDVGRLESGAPYIVMELLHGDDLAALLKKRGALPVREAVHYIMQACDALSEAHARGIVHRDLKPANLFLTRREDGSPCIKVLDFGVSKHIHPEGEAAEIEMTNSGDIMGSPLYMAPEQMRSAREVDARADVWALGSILYKLLTGKAPYQRATVPEIFMAVMSTETAEPPSSLRRSVPPGLDAVVMRCLEKDPDVRFASAQDLKAALTPYTDWVESKLAETAPTVGADDPSSSRHSSRRSIPKNIDAILLGCIGKGPARRAARAPGRRSTTDPFLRHQEAVAREARPSADSAPSIEVEVAHERIPAVEEPSAVSGTVPMRPEDLRAAAQIPFGPGYASAPPEALAELPRADTGHPSSFPGPLLLSPEEAAALSAPRVPSFPELPVPPSAPTARLPAASVLPAPTTGEGTGHSVAPWGYAPSAAPPPMRSRRARPLAFAAGAMTASFIVVALLMAFTSGSGNGESVAGHLVLDLPRPAAAAPVPVEPAEPESSAAAPAATQSASALASAAPRATVSGSQPNLPVAMPGAPLPRAGAAVLPGR
jgi:serine/threonine-protein kinase